jgi:hypothetical protein
MMTRRAVLLSALGAAACTAPYVEGGEPLGYAEVDGLRTLILSARRVDPEQVRIELELRWLNMINRWQLARAMPAKVFYWSSAGQRALDASYRAVMLPIDARMIARDVASTLIAFTIPLPAGVRRVSVAIDPGLETPWREIR